MIGKIIFVSRPTTCKDGAYQIIRFKLLDEETDRYRETAVCRLVDSFKNYGLWKDVIKVGNILDNLKVFGSPGKWLINADYKPKLIGVVPKESTQQSLF